MSIVNTGYYYNIVFPFKEYSACKALKKLNDSFNRSNLVYLDRFYEILHKKTTFFPIFLHI